MTACFYESEFEEELINLIRKNYGLSKNEILYFITRFMIVNNLKEFKNINKDFFIDFLLEENNLPKKLIYKNVYIDRTILTNIINNWFFDLSKRKSKNSLDFSFIENTVQNILKESISINSKLKKESSYNDSICLLALKILNKQFGVEFNSFFRMENLVYDNNHNDLERFREEKLELTLSVCKEIEMNPFSLINEHDVEEFLKNHLSLIEPDLKLIGTQYKIKDAFIDILAEDKNENKVIIELKIKSNDTRLIWQSIYYPLEVKKELNLDNIRMIIVAPKLDNSIFDCLEQLHNIEYFEYSVKLENSKICDLNLSKII